MSKLLHGIRPGIFTVHRGCRHDSKKNGFAVLHLAFIASLVAIYYDVTLYSIRFAQLTRMVRTVDTRLPENRVGFAFKVEHVVRFGNAEFIVSFMF